MKFLALAVAVFFSANSQAESNRLLRIPNRAQCALDSASPSTSIFLIVDGYNAGRLAYIYSKHLDQNAEAEAEAKLGMRDFRLSVANLESTVIDRLLSGDLPLLPRQFDQKERSLKNYQKFSQACVENKKCTDLHQLLKSIWSAQSNREQLRLIDNFTDEHFLKYKAVSSCKYLKNFTPLQAQIQNAAIKSTDLENLAVAVTQSSNFQTSCLDSSLDLNSQNLALQIDLPVQQDQWNSVGFDFWNSVKVYSSWAWRNAPEVRKQAAKFVKAFASLDLEESLMMIPNGCFSISPPACDQETLNTNALREMTEGDQSPTRFSALVPVKATEAMMSQIPKSDEPILGKKFDANVNTWIEHFTKKYVENRWVFKNKLLWSLQNMTLIATEFSVQQLAQLSRDLVQQVGDHPHLREEFAYMCLELGLAGDKKINFLRANIDHINEFKKINQLDSQTGVIKSLRF